MTALTRVACNLTTTAYDAAEVRRTLLSLGTASRNTPLPIAMTLIPERWSVAE